MTFLLTHLDEDWDPTPTPIPSPSVDRVLSNRPSVPPLNPLKWTRDRSYTIHRNWSPDLPEFHATLSIGATERYSTSAMNAVTPDSPDYLATVHVTRQQALEQLRWMRASGLFIYRYYNVHGLDTATLAHHCVRCLRVFHAVGSLDAHAKLEVHLTEVHHETVEPTDCSPLCGALRRYVPVSIDPSGQPRKCKETCRWHSAP